MKYDNETISAKALAKIVIGNTLSIDNVDNEVMLKLKTGRLKKMTDIQQEELFRQIGIIRTRLYKILDK